MYYNVRVTVPTKIVSLQTYKRRIREIVSGQLRGLFSPLRFKSWFFWLFSIFYIPCSIWYFAFCLLEIIADSVLLPISLIPKVRIISYAIQLIIWSFTSAVGCFSFIDQTYNLKDKELPAENKQTIYKKENTQDLIARSYVASEVSEELKKIKEEKKK